MKYEVTWETTDGSLYSVTFHNKSTAESLAASTGGTIKEIKEKEEE